MTIDFSSFYQKVVYGMKKFIDNDEGYLKWVDNNLQGFVINCNRQPNSRYLILHRADCRTITGTPANGESWTSGYMKVCSLDPTELKNWAHQEIKGNPRHCGICKP